MRLACKPRDRSIPLDYRAFSIPSPSHLRVSSARRFFAFLLLYPPFYGAINCEQTSRPALTYDGGGFRFAARFAGLNARRALASARLDDSLRKVITRQVEYFLNRVSRCPPGRRSQVAIPFFGESSPSPRFRGHQRRRFNCRIKGDFSLFIASPLIVDLRTLGRLVLAARPRTQICWRVMRWRNVSTELRAK